MSESREKIFRKLKLLSGYLDKLTAWLSKTTPDAYEEDDLRKHAAERAAELIIEAAIDINGEVILAADQPPPNTYYDSFLKAAKVGAYDMSLAQQLAPTAGFRNRLAHEYEEMDDAKAYTAIAALPALYQSYVRAVTAFLDSQSA
jgi:uncharacterized protein YutE (UPF0331/DUF86 family)